MLIQQVSRVLFGHVRNGFLFSELLWKCPRDRYQPLALWAFFYKGDQYWRVNCGEGDFEIVRFKLDYPVAEDAMVKDIEPLYLKWLQQRCQEVRLVVDPFDEMESFTSANQPKPMVEDK